MNTETTQTPQTTLDTTTSREQRTVWFRPAVDVLETERGFRLVIDVPGVRRDALELEVKGRRLTVQGRRTTGNTGWRHAFAVPEAVDSSAVTADLVDGVLTVELPRKAELGPRRIRLA